VLFDMDDTLFDHNRASMCATASLREREPLFQIWSGDELRRRHSEILEIVHRKVVSGELPIDEARRERFRRLLGDAGADESALGRAVELARWYRQEYEQSWYPVDGAMDLLTALKAAGIVVGIVTNNLRAEQLLKLERCALAPHIDALITSEDAGIAKPDPEIFTKALDALDLTSSDTVMVGDAWDTDIAGAIAAGLRPVWFNWRGLPMREPRVSELRSFVPAAEAMRVIV